MGWVTKHGPRQCRFLFPEHSRFSQIGHIIFRALVALKTSVPFTCGFVACSSRVKVEHTDRQTKYHNPRCACALRVNKRRTEPVRERERERERERAHIEAGGSIEQLDNVSNTCLGSLVKLLLLQLLHHVEHNVLAREKSPALQHLQNQLESLFLHDRPEELAATAANGGPEQGRYLLLVLVHHQQLRDSSVSDGASRSEDSCPAICLHELTADDSHQLLEHGTGEVVDDLAGPGLRQWLEIHRSLLDGVPRRLEQLQVLWGEAEEGEVAGVPSLPLLPSPQQPEEGTVGGEEFGVVADCRLIVGADSCHELGEAFLADGVSTAEADGEEGGGVVAIRAHRALEEVGPTRSLHYFFF